MTDEFVGQGIALFGAICLILAAVIPAALPSPNSVKESEAGGVLSALWSLNVLFSSQDQWALQEITIINKTVILTYSEHQIIFNRTDNIIWIDGCPLLELNYVEYEGWKKTELAPKAKATPPPADAPWIFSGIFSKLPYSYQVWDFDTEPSYKDYLAEYEIWFGYGNATRIDFKGFIPEQIHVTFFNGTNTAYTTYYWQLNYWTDPVITEELQ